MKPTFTETASEAVSAKVASQLGQVAAALLHTCSWC
jgi:hypothetical protein